MQVGINYPWFRYGWDFGPSVETYNPANDLTKQTFNERWDNPLAKPVESKSTPGNTLRTILEANLEDFKLNGIQVVRWFILGDGWNLGTPTLEKHKWAYNVQALAPSFANDLKTMLASFKKLDMKVIPVLTDFNMLGPGKFALWNLVKGKGEEIKIPTSADSVTNYALGYLNDHQHTYAQDLSTIVDWRKFVKGGKQSILNADRTAQFMKLIFDPLLSACKGYESQVYAWDICNEPDQGAKEFHLDPKLLASFLFEGLKRVKSTGMNATIGFKLQSSFASYFPTGKLVGAQFVNERFGKQYLPQFHYYPEKKDGNGVLQKQPNAPQDFRSNAILGEFGTRVSPESSIEWARSSVADRLRTIDQSNFGCALPWAARLDDIDSDWRKPAQDAVKAFTKQ